MITIWLNMTNLAKAHAARTRRWATLGAPCSPAVWCIAEAGRFSSEELTADVDG